MKTGLVIADAGPIFSLAALGRLRLLEVLFSSVRISEAVWYEITADSTSLYFEAVSTFFKDRVVKVSGFPDLTFVLGKGESESILLYKELNADFLLIDDNKARKIAERLGVNCVGTLGLLVAAKHDGKIDKLLPLFQTLLKNKRYYSKSLLNDILGREGEEGI